MFMFKTTHKKEMESLRLLHQQEMDALRVSSSSTIEALKRNYRVTGERAVEAEAEITRCQTESNVLAEERDSAFRLLEEKVLEGAKESARLLKSRDHARSLSSQVEKLKTEVAEVMKVCDHKERKKQEAETLLVDAHQLSKSQTAKIQALTRTLADALDQLGGASEAHKAALDASEASLQSEVRAHAAKEGTLTRELEGLKASLVPSPVSDLNFGPHRR